MRTTFFIIAIVVQVTTGQHYLNCRCPPQPFYYRSLPYQNPSRFSRAEPLSLEMECSNFLSLLVDGCLKIGNEVLTYPLKTDPKIICGKLVDFSSCKKDAMFVSVAQVCQNNFETWNLLQNLDSLNFDEIRKMCWSLTLVRSQLQMLS